MAFVYPQKVLFRHCDPAGLVFYPRYFEMINDCVEEFFGTALGVGFEEIHRDGAVPTVEISAKFPAPSRIGDVLSLALEVTRIGGRSLELNICATCEGQVRFEAVSTLVYVGLEVRAERWPEAIRDKLEREMRGRRV